MHCKDLKYLNWLLVVQNFVISGPGFGINVRTYLSYLLKKAANTKQHCLVTASIFSSSSSSASSSSSFSSSSSSSSSSNSSWCSSSFFCTNAVQRLRKLFREQHLSVLSDQKQHRLSPRKDNENTIRAKLLFGLGSVHCRRSLHQLPRRLSVSLHIH